MSTFVTVGNATQPFERLLRAVTANLDMLPKPVHVQHGAMPFSIPGCSAHPFLRMDQFAELVRCSNLLIMHCGAGSLMHALDAGKLPVVMPRQSRFGEHVDDHQIELAEALAGTGRIVMARWESELPNAICKAIEMGRMPRQPSGEPPLVGLVRDRLAAYVRE